MTSENNNATNDSEDKKGAAVKFPPPLVFVLFITAAYGLRYLYPLVITETFNLTPYAITIATVAFGIIIVSFFTFRFAKTTIEPWKPTSNIISTGIFAYSRNPIYLAFFFITIAFGLKLNSWWICFSAFPALIAIYHIAIKKEEAYLEAKFGEEYLNYKNKVRRWI